MSEVSPKSLRAGPSDPTDHGASEELAMAPLHGKADVNLQSAELEGQPQQEDRPSFIRYLAGFPAEIDLDDDVFARNPSSAWTLQANVRAMSEVAEPPIETVLEQLVAREPIFHRREFGTSREALEAMTDEAFWEIGASGRIYRRDFIIDNLVRRSRDPEPHDLPCRDFVISRLAGGLYHLSYILEEPDRHTRRTTLWKNTPDGWKILFHQGTVISCAAKTSD